MGIIDTFTPADLQYGERTIPVDAPATSQDSFHLTQGGFEIHVSDVVTGQALYDELFEQGRDLQVKPFISVGADSSAASQPVVKINLQQPDLSHCLGSQAWSPRLPTSTGDRSPGSTSGNR